MEQFKATLGRSAALITVFVTILFGVIIFSLFTRVHAGPEKYAITILLITIYFFVYAFHPTGYEISTDELIIRRLLFSVHIPRKNLVTAAGIAGNKASWSLRMIGVGGLFGYFGLFANLQLGTMTWYATRRNGLILLKTVRDEKIILTPDDTKKFLTALHLPTE